MPLSVCCPKKKTVGATLGVVVHAIRGPCTDPEEESFTVHTPHCCKHVPVLLPSIKC